MVGLCLLAAVELVAQVGVLAGPQGDGPEDQQHGGADNGDRAVVLISAEDYDALLETVDVLSRAEEVQALKDGLDDLADGRTSTVDEVRSAMLQRGRLRS